MREEGRTRTVWDEAGKVDKSCGGIQREGGKVGRGWQGGWSSNDGFTSSRPTSRLSKAEEKRQKLVSQLLTRRGREGRGGKEARKRTPLAVVPRLVGPELVNLARLVGDGLRVQLGLLLVVLSPAQTNRLATSQHSARRVRKKGCRKGNLTACSSSFALNSASALSCTALTSSNLALAFCSTLVVSSLARADLASSLAASLTVACSRASSLMALQTKGRVRVWSQLSARWWRTRGARGGREGGGNARLKNGRLVLGLGLHNLRERFVVLV